MKNITCRACDYKGSIGTFEPTASVYSDIRCPKCGSTNNQHNDDYLKKLSEAFAEAEKD